MKAPTMDQLRYQAELCRVGGREAREELWNMMRAYGVAYLQVEWVTVRTDKRNPMPSLVSVPVLASLYDREFLLAAVNEPMRLEDIPRSPLAGAVSRAVSA